jgi:hypothetical protein
MSAPFVAGTSFWITNDIHLWFIISDPLRDARRVLYVNVTTLDTTAPLQDAFNDRACVIGPGDHPFLAATSCVCYAGAHVCTVAHLEKKHARGELRFGQPASQALLEKMRKCSEKSIHMETDHFQILLDQELV